MNYPSVVPSASPENIVSLQPLLTYLKDNYDLSKNNKYDRSIKDEYARRHMS